MEIETGGVGRSFITGEEDSKDVDLPIGTLEKMRDLMISVEKAAAMLETGTIRVNWFFVYIFVYICKYLFINIWM